MAADLAVIVVSANSAHWLERCLPTVYARAGDIALDVVVAENASSDGTRDVVRSHPPTRLIECANHGFGHANNRALETTDAPYVLFLNPDTEILDGTLAGLVRYLEDDSALGVVAVRQVTSDGRVYPTIRRFPSVARWWLEALGSERLPIRTSWLGERELDLSAYGREVSCDWTTGAFMLVRRAALNQVGGFDEQFFLYSEEVDLCLRIKRAGWEIRHVPTMTILHHADKGGFDQRLAAQEAVSRRRFVSKHFGSVQSAAMLAALCVRYGIRTIVAGGASKRAANRSALRALLGLDPPPFE